MNEKIKSFFTTIGIFFAGVISCILGIFIRSKIRDNSGTTGRIEADTKQLQEIGTGLSGIGERLSESGKELRTNGERLDDLIERIEKQRIEK